MNLKNLLNYLKSNINDKVFDIIIFGSITRGKENPNDIDILIIFKKLDINLINTLSSNKDYNFHIQYMTIYDLYSLSSLLPEILAEGISVKYGKPLREILNFKAYKLYEIKDVILLKDSNASKTSFYYFLFGIKHRNKIGLIKELNGEVIRRNPYIIKIPIENSETFKKRLEIFSKLKRIKIKLEEKTIIEGRNIYYEYQ
ncbi:MAG: nucleotidyltransferase domain-containing protein [Nanopusillaceae archaeon]